MKPEDLLGSLTLWFGGTPCSFAVKIHHPIGVWEECVEGSFIS